MSLQVWLPLIGDLHNQGLADIDMSLVSGNTFITTDSKIGHGSLKLTKRQLISSTAFNSKKQISWALWVKVNTAWSAQWLDGIYWVTSDGSTTDSNRQEFYTNCTKVGMWYKGGSISGYNFTPGVWTHLAGTVDYENGQAAFYINGIQQGSTTNNVDTTRYITSVYIGDSGIDVQENDVRIYDHILSKKEIEEISKGLVLHYKLDNNGFGNPNLFRGTIMRPEDRVNFVSNSSTDWTKYLRHYNGSTSIHTFTEEDGVYIDTVKLNSAANLGICFGRLASEINLDSSSYYTISCEAKCTKAGAGIDIGLSYLTTSDSWVWRGGSNRKLFDNTTDWQFFTHTFKPDSNTKAIDYCFTVLGASGSTDTLSIRKCKLEKGSVATPWTPAPEDLGLDENIIYDSSGYQNNGEVINTITIGTDSSRYKAYTHFSATNQKIKISGLSTIGFSNSYTFAWWEKISSVTPMHWGFSDGVRLNGMYTGRLWNTGDGSNNPLYNPGTTTQVTAPSVNVWHHWAMVGNGTKCLVYQDGELWAEAKTYKTITGTTIFINGWNASTDYSSDNASISDFRLYSTALTAEQIKELYNTSATIDNKGNVYAREVIE